MRLGLHLSLGPNMVGGIRRAVEIGAHALQLFCGSPRSWEKSPFDPEVLAAYHQELAAAQLKPLAIHATYLLNPAAPSEAIWDKTVEALAVELARARDMHANFYVIHPGSHLGEGLEAGIGRIKTCLQRAWEIVPDAPPVLFENTAGAGHTIGRTFSDLGRMFRAIGAPARVGICLDTCHAYAAGYNITTKDGCAAMRKEIEGEVEGGLGAIKMLHINDSKFGCGENKDRHEHIGRGFIGDDGFRMFFGQFPFDTIGGILETPQNEEDDDRNDLRRMEQITSGQPTPPLAPPVRAAPVKPGRSAGAAKPAKNTKATKQPQAAKPARTKSKVRKGKSPKRK